MKSPLPTAREIEDLLSFLPKLAADGFEPIRRWHGGPGDDGETGTMPWPEYDPLVVDFFKVASGQCWSDYEYRPDVAGRMLTDAAVVERADLKQIRTMLTSCVRGERFCSGHWGAKIERGYIPRLLLRLAEIE